jgi:hypothetical protein
MGCIRLHKNISIFLPKQTVFDSEYQKNDANIAVLSRKIKNFDCSLASILGH